MPLDLPALKKYIRIVIELAFLGALLFLIGHSSTVEYLFKLFSNTFMVGRSPIKVYFFVIFLFVLWKIYYSKPVFQKNVFRTHRILVGGIFLVGVAEFLSFYLDIYGKDPQFLSNIINIYMPPFSTSTTSLLHIHNSKIIFAYLFSLGHGAQFFYSFDPGAPFLDFYSIWLILAQLFLFGAYLVVSFLLLFQLKKKLGIASYFGFGLALLVITKNLTDGGLFNGEAWLFGLPFYLFFGMRGMASSRKGFWKSLLALGGVVLFFYVSYSAILWLVDFPFPIAQADYIASLTRYLLAFVIISGVSFLDKKIQKKPAEKEVIAFAAALLCFSFFIGNLCEIIPGCLSNDYHRMRNSSLSKGSVVVAAGFAPDAFDGIVQNKEATILEKISLEHYIRARLRLDQETTYYDLCKKTGINPSIGSISVVGTSCDEGNSLSFRQDCWVEPFLEAKEVDIAKDFRIEVSPPGDRRIVNGKDFFRQKVITTLPGCTPILATARLNLMKEIGIRKAVCNRHPLEVFRISKKGVWTGEVE